MRNDNRYEEETFIFVGCRMLARLPLVLCGWYEEKQLLKVELFKGYKERADVPFCVFRVALMVSAIFTFIFLLLEA